MYSMASSAVLAMDLVKHRNGIAVADVLDRALTLTGADLADLEDAHVDDDARRIARAEADRLCSGQPRLHPVATALRRARGAGYATAPTADLLGRAPIGNLDDLSEMVRSDILGWTTERTTELGIQRWAGGVTAVLDALAAEYARPDLDTASAYCLKVPWIVALGELPPALPPEDGLGAGTAAVRRIVDEVATGSPALFTRIAAEVAATGTSPVDWAVAMHTAARATHRTGRTRTVARAQLALARAVLIAPVPQGGTGPAVLMALTGVVAATLAADALQPETAATLRAAWDATVAAA